MNMLAALTRLPGECVEKIQPGFLRVLGVRNQRTVLPRNQCHFVILNAKGLPPRYLASALSLQLIQLGFVAQPGFAWRVVGDNAQVWYWDEAKVRAKLGEGGWVVQPEPLLRSASTGGLRLLRCTAGFEAEYAGANGAFRTRWFAQEPDEAQWAEFCRDAGLDPADHPRGAPKVMPLSAKCAKGWRIHTRLTRTLPAWAWGLGALVLAYGCVVADLGVKSFRLKQETARIQTKLDGLQQADATQITLQADIDKLNAMVDRLNALRPKRTQLSLMQSLADLGVVGLANGVVLTNWSYQNHRVSMTFYTAKASLTGSEMVSRIEKMPGLHKVQLMTDAQPGFLIIQASLDGAETPEAQDSAPATSSRIF